MWLHDREQNLHFLNAKKSNLRLKITKNFKISWPTNKNSMHFSSPSSAFTFSKITRGQKSSTYFPLSSLQSFWSARWKRRRRRGKFHSRQMQRRKVLKIFLVLAWEWRKNMENSQDSCKLASRWWWRKFLMSSSSLYCFMWTHQELLAEKLHNFLCGWCVEICC